MIKITVAARPKDYYTTTGLVFDDRLASMRDFKSLKLTIPVEKELVEEASKMAVKTYPGETAPTHNVITINFKKDLKENLLRF